MAAATEAAAWRPEQLWLDVARPIQPRPPRERREASRGLRTRDAPGPQMELAMAARAPAQGPVLRTTEVGAASPPAPVPPPPPAAEARDAAERRPCFVTWLLGQGKRGCTIGELAKAARADRMFPRMGSVEDVRALFDAAGADGDAHAALDDAERAYDRSGCVAIPRSDVK